MDCTRRGFVAAMGAAGAMALGACVPTATTSAEEPEPIQEESEAQELQVDPDEYAKLALDMDAWHYDKESDCYYQLGLSYCLTPATALEQLAIFVPGAYFKGVEGRSTYSCTVNRRAKVGGFSPKTAPVAMPLNVVRYGAQEPTSAFSPEGLERYLKAGFIYVYAGLRGRSSTYESDADEVVPGGAPWALVDLKAAIRYLRYNASSLPCDASRVFVFGMGGGGGIGMVAGASGNSSLFTPYLASIGAAMHDGKGRQLSDDIYGVASWCPLTSFDVIDAAYEWECGQFSPTGSRAEGAWGRLLSQDLVAAYAAWVNGAGLADADGTPLTLEEVGDGSFTAGTYYDHVLAATEDAAAAFLETTQFPYTYAPAPTAIPAFPGNPDLSLAPTDDVDAAIGETVAANGGVPGVTNVQATVYDSIEAYVDALNAPTRWLTYNSYWGTIRVSGLWDMAKAVRATPRAVSAFDAPDRSTSLNQLFGVAKQTTLHFSQMVGDVVSEGAERYAAAGGWKSDYPEQWAVDLTREDALGSLMGRRVDMMNPLSYVCVSYRAYGTAQVAPYWRVNAGLFQAETSLASVANLAVALGSYEGVSSVAFTPVWGRGFELAERSGDAQENLIAWMCECCMQ